MASINSTMDTAEKMKALEAAKLQIEKRSISNVLRKENIIFLLSASLQSENEHMLLKYLLKHT